MGGRHPFCPTKEHTHSVKINFIIFLARVSVFCVEFFLKEILNVCRDVYVEYFLRERNRSL